MLEVPGLDGLFLRRCRCRDCKKKQTQQKETEKILFEEFDERKRKLLIEIRFFDLVLDALFLEKRETAEKQKNFFQNTIANLLCEIWVRFLLRRESAKEEVDFCFVDETKSRLP